MILLPTRKHTSRAKSRPRLNSLRHVFYFIRVRNKRRHGLIPLAQLASPLHSRVPIANKITCEEMHVTGILGFDAMVAQVDHKFYTDGLRRLTKRSGNSSLSSKS